MTVITVVGGGLAGLVAGITCAEAGAGVRLHEAHSTLGGRARTSPPPYIANEGPHVVYADGPLWAWLRERDLIGRAPGVPLRAATGSYFRLDGRLRRRPPTALLRMLATARRHRAPVDRSFADWAGDRFGDETARLAANLMGVVTFEADPGRLSAAFVWERLVRVFTTVPPAARYVVGGWGQLVDRLAARARELGVHIETGSRVDALPEPPVIVATSLEAAASLLGDQTLRWTGGRTVLWDLAVRKRRGDAFLVSDLDEAGWLERYTLPDPTLAPPGESLVQAQLPLRPDESKSAGLARLESMVELALPGWRDRLTWQRTAVAAGRSGALDLPGQSWRDRPRIDRGGGVFLAGDMVAAPGVLSEVAFNSALTASKAALQTLGVSALSDT
jgi:phytoene dehydrogenase-like protein